MSNDNIVQFPTKSVPLRVDKELDLASFVMPDLLQTLQDSGIDINEEKFIEDLDVIFNLLYAMIVRNVGDHHALHPVLEDIYVFMNEESDTDDYAELEFDDDDQ